MKHIFDVDIAKEYGINCAIILENLNYWITKNEANEENFYDGKYWTYNSVKAFTQLFPYMSKNQITTALKNLEDKGIIVTGNYNKVAYDRTKWYSITEFGKSIINKESNAFMNSDNSIYPKSEMEEPKSRNGITENQKPIPNINTDVTSIINKDIYIAIKDCYNSTCKSLPKVITLSDGRKRTIKARLKKFSIEQLKEAFEKAEKSSFLTGDNKKNWRANFDFIMTESKLIKILEGNYDNKEKKEEKVSSTVYGVAEGEDDPLEFLFTEGIGL